MNKELKLPNITCATFSDWLEEYHNNREKKTSSNKLVLIIDKNTNQIEKYDSIEKAYYFSFPKDSNTNL